MMQLELTKTLNFSTGKSSLNLQTTIELGSLVALYGKSGAGKTTILRMIAGLMQPQTGRIILANNVWFDSSKKINQTPQQRNVGFVFQDYALFPNMTVLENLTFALKKGQSATIIKELMEIMELNGLKKQYPRFLSGGQQQRVALARALVQRPKILLLDEPLSALDATMRTTLQSYLLKVHQQYQLTTIMVSHNEAEILSMANRVLVLENGKITDDVQPTVLFHQKEPQSIDLKGTILAIHGKKATVKIGKNSIETELSNHYNYKVGDDIELSFLKK